VDVHLPGGPVRPYSLCNDPRETHRYQLGVLREPASRGGSAGMHALQPDAALRIGAPRNQFALAAGARRSLLFAGGIGITPILAMAEALAAEGADFTLHHSVRSAAHAAFRDRLHAFAGRVQWHVDDGPAAQKLDAATAIGAPEPGTHLYVCGPAGYMAWLLDTARALGWPEERLHREHFGAVPVATAEERGFEVQLVSSGTVVRVAPGQSVVEALAAAGVTVPVSCEQGICGTCLTRVVDGTPEHRDAYLTDEEHARNDCFTPCCSRARSPRLVLAL
jgi:vanillate O-demethylase ferredoxin subunit